MAMAYVYLLVVLLAFHTPQIVTATKFSLSLRLIHRHSISSSRFGRNWEEKFVSLDDDIRAPVMAKEDGSLFLVNISMGEPPVPQLLAMDTGSHVIWVRCSVCDECNYDTFDPKRSSAYTELSRYSPQCSKFSYDFQEKLSQCSFSIRYEDQSSSRGILALEKFTFVTSTGGTVQVPDVVFGCALRTNGGASNLNGILGLEATNEYSLVARTGNRFSYCIGSIRDTQYMYNQLIFGEGAIIEGDSTPVQIKGGHYVVSLEGISLGEKELSINEEEFRYNVVIDSGTTLTRLWKSAYEAVEAEVKGLLDGVLQPVRVVNAEDQLCYRGDLERDLKGFPVVSLHLSEGTQIDLDVEALFSRTVDGSAFCMAIVKAEDNLIGILAQQYYNVGFDLDAMRISFQRIDCELLQD